MCVSRECYTRKTTVRKTAERILHSIATTLQWKNVLESINVLQLLEHHFDTGLQISGNLQFACAPKRHNSSKNCRDNIDKDCFKIIDKGPFIN